MIPSVSQYACEQLLTGQQAEAYADHFIAVHITNMAGGETYSQLSAKAIAQPNNTALANTVNTVFKGETLRSMLLNAYGWWKVSQITYIISLAAFGLGTVSFLAGLFGFGPPPRPQAGRRQGPGHRADQRSGPRGRHHRLTSPVNPRHRPALPRSRRREPGKRCYAAPSARRSGAGGQ